MTKKTRILKYSVFNISISWDLSKFGEVVGSGALSGKILLVRIIENNKIDAFLGQVRLLKG